MFSEKETDDKDVNGTFVEHTGSTPDNISTAFFKRKPTKTTKKNCQKVTFVLFLRTPTKNVSWGRGGMKEMCSFGTYHIRSKLLAVCFFFIVVSSSYNMRTTRK